MQKNDKIANIFIASGMLAIMTALGIKHNTPEITQNQDNKVTYEDYDDHNIFCSNPVTTLAVLGGILAAGGIIMKLVNDRTKR